MSLQRGNSGPQSPEWMIVYTTHNVPEAHIVAGRLEHEGIQAMVHTQAGASAIGITIGSLGEVKVLVKPDDYERALDILEPEPPPELPDTTDDTTYHWPEEGEDDG